MSATLPYTSLLPPENCIWPWFARPPAKKYEPWPVIVPAEAFVIGCENSTEPPSTLILPAFVPLAPLKRRAWPAVARISPVSALVTGLAISPSPVMSPLLVSAPVPASWAAPPCSVIRPPAAFVIAPPTIMRLLLETKMRPVLAFVSVPPDVKVDSEPPFRNTVPLLVRLSEPNAPPPGVSEAPKLIVAPVAVTVRPLPTVND